MIPEIINYLPNWNEICGARKWRCLNDIHIHSRMEESPRPLLIVLCN